MCAVHRTRYRTWPPGWTARHMTHRTAPSRSVHHHHPRWGPRQYRVTAGRRCPSYRRATSDTKFCDPRMSSISRQARPDPSSQREIRCRSQKPAFSPPEKGLNSFSQLAFCVSSRYQRARSGSCWPVSKRRGLRRPTARRCTGPETSHTAAAMVDSARSRVLGAADRGHNAVRATQDPTPRSTASGGRPERARPYSGQLTSLPSPASA